MLTQPAGTAPRAAVVGSPVAHSLSPVLHRAGWTALGLLGGSYERVDVAAGGLARAAGDLAARGITGLSVTMPLKEEALALGAAGAGTTEVARLAGGANTLVLGPAGWFADNTDVPGLARVLARAVPGHHLTGGPRPVLLGSGATARSALLALHRLGAEQVLVGVRSRVRPELADLAERLGMELEGCSLAEAAQTIGQAVGPLLVVSTLPAGWTDGLEAPAWPTSAVGADGSSSAAGTVWVDAQYAGWPHPWAQGAQGAGASVVSGLHMLVEQAVDQVELMTGRRPSGEGVAAGIPEELRALHRV